MFPVEASTIVWPGASAPVARACSMIRSATRSLTLPFGFADSSFAKSHTPGEGESRRSSTSGVRPTRSAASRAMPRLGGGCVWNPMALRSA